MPITQEFQNNLEFNYDTNEDILSRQRNTYSISNMQYPDDLGEEDLKHFIQFNIIVRGKSKYFQDQKTEANKVRRTDSAQLSEEQLSAASTASLVLGGSAAATAGGAIVSNFKQSLTNKSKSTGGQSGVLSTIAKKTALPLVGGVAGYAASTTEFLKPDTSYRISDFIALYIDGPPSVRYNAQYSNKELGTLAGIAGGIASGVGSASQVGTEMGAALAMQFSKIPQLAGVNTADVVGASSKTALNPFKEVLFEAIDFRTFSFKYRFFPKNKKESETVRKIIDTFKFHMHPELSANKLFFIYPSEFEISYHFENKENNYFHKFKPCVLETMDVNYGGETFSSFVDGNPTEVNMTLVFRETEILTKQQIENGY